MSERGSTTDFVSAALVFIERHGSLDGFDLDAEDQQRVLDAARNQDLIVWNKRREKYELGHAGHKWLIVNRRKSP